jgi:dipeptidase D
MEKIAQLEPRKLWHYFLEICKIPRPSKKEEKIAAWLMEFGKAKGLETLRDETGNVLIRKPAAPGYDKLKPVILQAHMDMVCEKNTGTVHDFGKDPIIPHIDGDWIRAKGTTLGADDGIGIAAMLAILDSGDIAHGPLEALFTVDEETGLSGAFGLKPGFLKGKILLNLDSEDEGQLFIGCAGGRDTVGTIPVVTQPAPANHVSFRVAITGLRGGHSGDDINKGLGNAVKLLNRYLWNVTRLFNAKISSIDAGNLRNAIAREGFAVITVPAEAVSGLAEYSNNFHRILKAEFKVTEPGVKFVVESYDMPAEVLTDELQSRLLNLLYAIPHGVVDMSQEIPDFVETSTNLASVKTQEKNIIITSSQRSSIESAKQNICDMMASTLELGGAAIEQSAGYPGWKPNPNSAILKVTVAAYRKLFNEEPAVLAIHAGLECGLIGAMYHGMDMVSFGPTIKGAHSPDERLHIATTRKFWDLTLEVLKTIPEK